MFERTNMLSQLYNSNTTLLPLFVCTKKIQNLVHFGHCEDTYALSVHLKHSRSIGTWILKELEHSSTLGTWAV